MLKAFINVRNLLALAVVGRGRYADECYRRVHVSKHGTTATDGCRLIRVSLPPIQGEEQGWQVQSGCIDPGKAKEYAQQYSRNRNLQWSIFHPEIEPREDVYRYEAALNDQATPVTEIVVDAALLLGVVRAAARFSDDPYKAVRLRLQTVRGCPRVRIDAAPTKNGQKLTALVCGLRGYDDDEFSGDHNAFANCGKHHTCLPTQATDGRLYRKDG